MKNLHAQEFRQSAKSNRYSDSNTLNQSWRSLGVSYIPTREKMNTPLVLGGRCGCFLEERQARNTPNSSDVHQFICAQWVTQKLAFPANSVHALSKSGWGPDARPRRLAALLDAAAAALSLQDSVKPANLPRMADWYLFAFAAAHHEAFGFSPAEFEAAYQANRQDSVDMAIDSCLIARPLLDILFMLGSWEGTTTDLLAELADRVDVNMPKSPEWPRTPEALSHELKRIESNLRTQGVEIQRSRDSITRARKLMIRQRQ